MGLVQRCHGLPPPVGILYISGGLDRLFVPVNSQVGLCDLLRNIDQHEQVGEMLRIILLPNSQLHAIEAGQVQPSGRNSDPAIFYLVLQHGADSSQQFRLHADADFGSGIPGGDDYGGIATGGIGAIACVAYQQGGVGQVR